MKKCCQNCKFYLEQSIGNVCRLDLYSVKSTDCCEKYENCIEEKDDNWWKIMRNTIVIILILIGINSLFLNVILQREVAKFTDNIWICWGVGCIHLCPIFNFIFLAIKKIIEVKK